METAAVALPKAPQLSLGESLKVAVLPSEKSDRPHVELARRSNELVRNVAFVLDEFIATAIETRSAKDFADTLSEIFPKYLSVMTSLDSLLRVVVPHHAIDRLESEWLCELEADFRDVGPKTFGEDLTERGLFTVWTLRKIVDLAQQISRTKPPQEISDEVKSADFVAKALWTRFHVDCLVKAMRDERPIHPGIVEPIREGLRMAVNTYASIRILADMQDPVSEPIYKEIEWSEEDQVLLNDSMQDLGA